MFQHRIRDCNAGAINAFLEFCVKSDYNLNIFDITINVLVDILERSTAEETEPPFQNIKKYITPYVVVDPKVINLFFDKFSESDFKFKIFKASILKLVELRDWLKSVSMVDLFAVPNNASEESKVLELLNGPKNQYFYSYISSTCGFYHCWPQMYQMPLLQMTYRLYNIELVNKYKWSLEWDYQTETFSVVKN